jgi:Tfp pilus assembly protein PilF
MPPIRRFRATLIRAWPFLAALAVALGLRVAYLVQIQSWPAFDQPAVDAGYHDAWGKALAFDDWHASRVYDVTPMRTSSYFRPPGHPFFLAAVYRLFGSNPLYPRVAQMALGLAALIILAAFSSRWYGRTVGWLTVLLAGSYWGFIYFEGELLETSLLVFLGVTLVASLAQAGANAAEACRFRACLWALPAGMLLGSHALVRPNVLLFAPAAAVWLWWQTWKSVALNRAVHRGSLLQQGPSAPRSVPKPTKPSSGDAVGGGIESGPEAGPTGCAAGKSAQQADGGARPSSRMRHLLESLFPVCTLTIGCLAIVLPVTLRNWRVAGEFVPISANGGINLYIGNHEGAEGLFVGSTAEFGAFGTSSVYEDIVAGLSRQAGHAVSYGEADRHFADKARAWIRAHPWRALGLVWRKFVYLCSAWETGHNRSIYWDRRKLPVIRYLPGNWGVLLALSAAGLVLVSGRFPILGSRRSDEPVHLNTEHRTPTTGNPVSSSHVPPSTLHPPPSTCHLPPTSLILLFFGCYSASFLPFFVTGQYRMPLAVWLCLGSAVAVVAGWELVRRAAWRRLAASGMAALAVYGFTAVNWNGFEPNLAKWWLDDGIAWEGKDRSDLAKANYRLAVAAGGRTGKAWYNLGCLEMKQQRLGEAIEAFGAAVAAGLPEIGKTYNNLGNCLLRSGRGSEAVRALSQAVTREPENPEFLSNYGTALMAAGMPLEARRAFERALAVREDLAFTHFQMGVLLRKAGENDAALGHLRRAVELRPEMAATAARVANP